eukprot:4883009-Amphidinium_carterae.1
MPPYSKDSKLEETATGAGWFVKTASPLSSLPSLKKTMGGNARVDSCTYPPPASQILHILLRSNITMPKDCCVSLYASSNAVTGFREVLTAPTFFYKKLATWTPSLSGFQHTTAIGMLDSAPPHSTRNH